MNSFLRSLFSRQHFRMVSLNCTIVLAMICFHHSQDAFAQDLPEYSEKMDKLERQLELYRHQKLVQLKENPDNHINTFTTDGCSGGLSVGWEYLAETIETFDENFGQAPPWESCCITHDSIYHAGGERTLSGSESFEARKTADLQLMQCVQDIGLDKEKELTAQYDLSPKELHTLFTTISLLMYRAVRIGGIPCTSLPWRWGYGWPECDP